MSKHKRIGDHFLSNIIEICGNPVFEPLSPFDLVRQDNLLRYMVEIYMWLKKAGLKEESELLYKVAISLENKTYNYDKLLTLLAEQQINEGEDEWSKHLKK